MTSLSQCKPVSNLSQSGRLNFLLKDVIIYGGATAISRAMALFTFPLLARHLSIEEYGVLDYFLVLGSFLSIFFIFGQDSAVARFFYEYEETHIRQQLISQSLLFQLLGLVLLLPVLWLGAEWLTSFMIAAPERVELFKIVLLQLPSLLLISFSQNLLKWTFARTRFLIISIGFTVVQASLLVVAIQIFDVGIMGVLVVSLASSTALGILGLFFVRKWLAYPKDLSRIREMLTYSIPIGIVCIISALLPTLERTFTESLLGADSLGLYAAGTKVAMLMGLLVSAFQIAWGPFHLSIYKQTDAINTYNWVLKLFALAVCIAALSLGLLAKFIILLLATERYLGAVVVVFPLAMGLAIQATGWITEIGIGISKRSYFNLYAFGVAILFTLGGILLFTPIYGLLGVGLGVLSGQIAKVISASWLGQHSYRMPWNYAPVVVLMSITLLSGFVTAWITEQYGMLVGNLITGVILLLTIVGGWLILFSEDERIIMKLMLKRRLFNR